MPSITRMRKLPVCFDTFLPRNHAWEIKGSGVTEIKGCNILIIFSLVTSKVVFRISRLYIVFSYLTPYTPYLLPYT